MTEEEDKSYENGFLYKVNESEIFVSGRPKGLFSVKVSSYDADAYLGVTDSFCSIPVGKMFVWFPWNEGRMPIPEMYYACNKALIWWVQYKKVPKIQVYCDGGTHRSVTVFGAFLLTYFPSEAKKIVAERTALGRVQDDASNPLEYIEGYLNDIPEDRLLFKAMGENRLGSLESHSSDIYREVKKRYGEDRNNG